MPVVERKAPPPTSWSLRLGAAVGRAADLWAVGMCPELDEHERRRGREHDELTHVVRYERGRRTVVERVDGRIDGLWQPPGGPILGVGDAPAYVEIDASGVRRFDLPGVPGSFSSLWGPNEAHLFACGAHSPFAWYRREGSWQPLALPPGVGGLYDVHGRDEREVYFVGDRGVVLLWDGDRLTRLQVATEAHLRSIARLDERRFCVGGYGGTLLLGDRRGWHDVPIADGADLLALAALHDKVYFGSDDALWSFDGAGLPQRELDLPTRWVSGLEDGLLLSWADEARLLHAGTVTRLDTTV